MTLLNKNIHGLKIYCELKYFNDFVMFPKQPQVLKK